MTVGPVTPALDRRTEPRDNDDVANEIVIHQCPYCDLRFAYHNDVKVHVLHDHPDRTETVAGIEPHEIPHA